MKVLLLYTGGTLGMIPSAAGVLVPAPAAQFRQLLATHLPGLGSAAGITWELRSIPGERPYDSSDINADHWLRIAAFIEAEYERWDGFVVIHGTDTMAYTASGLSFLFENLAKPVVLTGSQLPLWHERSDARANLANALYLAGYRAAGLACVPEVSICFGHYLLRGNRARKVSTADLNGFESPHYPALAVLGERIEIRDYAVRPMPAGAFRVHKRLCMDVMDITLFPGMRPEHLRALLASPNLRGLLIRTFAAGNIMNDPRILAELREAIERGVVVLNITQCLRGRVEMGLYANSSTLAGIGAVSGLDMTPEAGLAKMMWALANAPGRLRENLRGEQEPDA